MNYCRGLTVCIPAVACVRTKVSSETAALGLGEDRGGRWNFPKYSWRFFLRGFGLFKRREDPPCPITIATGWLAALARLLKRSSCSRVKIFFHRLVARRTGKRVQRLQAEKRSEGKSE